MIVAPMHPFGLCPPPRVGAVLAVEKVIDMAGNSAARAHHTETVDRRWDGPAAERGLGQNASQRQFRQLFAWIDSTNTHARTAHKFPHHEVSRDGKVGPANVRAVRTAIAILNGARGGAKIPDADRRPVYRHLAPHLNDAGEEPPSLKD